MAPTLRSFVRFFIYSNLFISACAFGLTLETCYFLGLPAGYFWLPLLVAAGTLFIYSLHYYVKSRSRQDDERLLWNRKYPMLTLAMMLAGLATAAGLLLGYLSTLYALSPREAITQVLLLVGLMLLALLYSHRLVPGIPKSIRFLGGVKLVWLAGAWTLATLLLPVWLYSTNSAFDLSSGWIALFLHRFLFIASVGFLFNLRDQEEDRKDGIRTLAVLLGTEKGIFWGKWIFLALNTLAFLLLALRFHLTDPIWWLAGSLPVLLVFLAYSFFRPATDEAAFVWRHDGLLLIKALLLIFAVITTNG